MPTHGYAARRPSPLVLAGILGGHAAALAALMLIKTVYVTQTPPGPLETYEVPAETPPPLPEPPPPDQKVAETPTPVTTVQPRIVVPTQGPVVQPSPTEIVDFRPAPPGPEIEYAEVMTPRLPPPTPVEAFVPAPRPAPIGVKPRGNPGGWVTNEDYPAAALRNEEQGRTAFRLEVGPDGRPTACSVTASSGSSVLDGAACRLLMRRAKFVPGRDADGQSVGGVYANSFNWKIPEG